MHAGSCQCELLILVEDQEIKERIARYRDELDHLLDGGIYEFAESKREDITEASGVYVIYDKVSGQILYIGESGNLRRRLFGNHRSGNRSSVFRSVLSRWEKLEDEKKIDEYIIQNCSFQVLLVSDKLERKRFEHFAIAVLSPTLNDVVRLKIL